MTVVAAKVQPELLSGVTFFEDDAVIPLPVQSDTFTNDTDSVPVSFIVKNVPLKSLCNVMRLPSVPVRVKLPDTACVVPFVTVIVCPVPVGAVTDRLVKLLLPVIFIACPITVDETLKFAIVLSPPRFIVFPLVKQLKVLKVVLPDIFAVLAVVRLTVVPADVNEPPAELSQFPSMLMVLLFPLRVLPPLMVILLNVKLFVLIVVFPSNIKVEVSALKVPELLKSPANSKLPEPALKAPPLVKLPDIVISDEPALMVPKVLLRLPFKVILLF